VALHTASWTTALLRTCNSSLNDIRLTFVQSVVSYLLTLTTLTCVAWYTIDPQILSRDPASSPGPFPIRLMITTFVTRSKEATILSPTHDVCLPGCECAQKLPPWSPTAHGSLHPADLLRTTRDVEPVLLSRVPLSIPTPAQRTRVYSVQLRGGTGEGNFGRT
jgi:hypothetical protein